MGGRGSCSITSRMPRYRYATIARAKIRDYLLSPKNPGGKAAYFKSLGYTTRNAGRFKNDLLKGLRNNESHITGRFQAVPRGGFLRCISEGEIR